MTVAGGGLTQTLSVVVPAYRAGRPLRGVVEELLATAADFEVGGGVELVLEEVVLVCDNPALPAQERRDLAALEQLDPRVRTVWLSRNFGQHPATVAGIVSTNGDWVVTMDEDGQHDPSYVPAMLRAAAEHGRPLVYARPTNAPPHGAVRNVASRLSKALFRSLSGSRTEFHSFRLMEGGPARSACAYIGEGVYLDVAMGWSCGEAAPCPVPMRAEEGPSTYDYRRLLSHFWRMVLSTGGRPLRLVAAGGLLLALAGLLLAVLLVVQRMTDSLSAAPGVTSSIVIQLVLSGGLFVTLATLAEYVSFAARNSIGKPLYVLAEHADARVLWALQAQLAGDRVPTA